MSIRRLVTVSVAATAAVLAFGASSAMAATSASLSVAKAEPSSPVAGKASPGGIYISSTNCRTGDAGCISSDGLSPTQQIDGIYATSIDFSPNILFNSATFKAGASCSTATIQAAATVKDVQLACTGAVQGSGGATACVGGPGCSPGITGENPALVINGGLQTPPDPSINKGKPTPNVKLYVNVAPLGVAGRAVYDAWVVTSSKAAQALGYKKQLLIPGSGSPGVGVTNFWANVGPGLIKVKCGTTGANGTDTIKFLETWVVNEGTPTAYTDNKSQSCNYHTP